MPQSARRVAEPDPAPRDAKPAPSAPETAPPAPTAAARPSAKAGGLDGFRVEADAARQRLDIILDRPPLNVITMNQREQLRVAFEAADADNRVRVIVLRAVGEHFSSGGEVRGFLDASPEHLSRLAGTSRRRRAAGSRSSPPAAAIASASGSSWLWPAIFGSSPKARFTRCPNSGSA